MNTAPQKNLNNQVIGIVGGGQLARMLALAGIPLGLRFVFLDPATDACAAPLGRHICNDFNNTEALDELASLADIITYEFENVPESAINQLARHLPVFPGSNALSISRDRLREKTLFQELDIPIAPFMPVNTKEELNQAVATIGLPAVLKTRTLGYDGKGQFILRHQNDVDTAWEKLGDVPLILEGFVQFDREVSIIGVRGHQGETAFYPLTKNVHDSGILQLSVNLSNDELQSQSEAYAKRIMDHLGYVGTITLELFDTGNGLIANEMAPRVHNSGHWTIEGAITSQFENHLRAILKLPLGSTDSIGKTAMVNFIGSIPDINNILSIPCVALHDYGKKPREGRKVGHATLHTENDDYLYKLLPRLLAISNEKDCS
jgi:5-(carboxyamino)imidazole ribonucleotide synthase